ncbi:MAG: ComEC/Rec2 family competence protein [Alphaproteobacteria bacterium]
MSTDARIFRSFSGRYQNSLMVALGDRFESERTRWTLWSPVLLGIGIAVYFWWPTDPGLIAGFVLVGLAGLLALIGRGALRFCGIVIGLVTLGFLASGLRDTYVAAPVIAEKTGPVSIEGQVERVERYPDGHSRITLRNLAVSRLSENAVPERIRLRVRTQGDAVQPGNLVTMRAILMPPPPPVAPGAFDFARKAWFERLGAVGFAISGVSVTAQAPEGAGLFERWRLARFRDALAQRLADQAPDDAGAVAVALMTGERGLIPEQITEDLRAAGLAHLLAISGLHIGLMAGLAFFVVRAGLALVPPIALRYPIKKWAAIAALCAALFYLMISGGTVPTQRAFAMSAIVLTAIIFDRLAITMRLVALVAGAMLLLTPESLLNVSFQMSFAAVIALVAVYEHARSHGWLPGRGVGWLRRFGIYVLGVGITSVVAGLATGFFAVVHFNRFANYGLLANLLAVPVMALWIMPWAMAAFLLMPFGLEAWALEPMGWGIDLVTATASWVAHMPGAVSHIAAIPGSATVLVCLGGLWLCLWQQRWRIWGLAPIVAGLILAGSVSPPDLLIDEQGKLIALRGQGGQMAFNKVNGSAMSVDTWSRRSGQMGAVRWQTGADHLACDATGCLYRAESGALVALVRTPEALAEDCSRAHVVISAVPVFGRCRRPNVVIDRFDLWREGAHAFWFGHDGARTETVAQHQGNRPWSRYAIRQRRD